MRKNTSKKNQKNTNKFKEYWKKTWNFIWYDDSIASWLVNIILAFVIIKYMLYPLLGLIVGTNLPVVAVISESMEHEVNFDSWWTSQAECSGKLCTQKDFYEEFNISKEQFEEFTLKNGFKRGDIIFLLGTKFEKLKVGDVIVFSSKSDSYPIIHRIIEINQESFSYITKGDNNIRPIYVENHLNEYNVSFEDVIGKGVLKIPYLGYVKISFVDSIEFIKNIFHN